MTRAQTQSESCSECRGKHYLLSNTKGLLYGERCSCFACEVCGGRGQIFEENESGVSMLKECACAVLTKRLAKLNEAGIPGKFANTEFATYYAEHGSQKLAKRQAEDFVKDFGKTYQGLLFMGRPGLGKTHLAVSVIKALILEEDADCKFVDFFQLLSDIRQGYSQDLSEQAIINPYVHAQVLVVDELAKRRSTEWELTMLDQIISSRYNDADKITLFTTNFLDERPHTPTANEKDDSSMVNTATYREQMAKKETLLDKVGERIYSRLKEMCRFIPLEGTDFRLSVKKHSPDKPKARKR